MAVSVARPRVTTMEVTFTVSRAAPAPGCIILLYADMKSFIELSSLQQSPQLGKESSLG